MTVVVCLKWYAIADIGTALVSQVDDLVLVFLLIVIPCTWRIANALVLSSPYCSKLQLFQGVSGKVVQTIIVKIEVIIGIVHGGSRRIKVWSIPVVGAS